MRICLYLSLLLLVGCADHYYNQGGGYSGSGGYYDPYDRDRYYDERERRRLERERYEIERERRRLEEERRKRHHDHVERPVARPPAYAPPVVNKPQQERCPSGFTPSERKCTSAERKKGCKDMRLPGGLGCVKR